MHEEEWHTSDDILVVSNAPAEVMKQIGNKFEFKNNEYGPSTASYLGAGPMAKNAG